MSVFSDEAYAIEQDDRDPLKHFRSQYHFPKEKNGQASIYLCGNSLGLQSVRTKADVFQALDQWAECGVKGHFDGAAPWISFQDDLVKATARIVGAIPGEVTIMNTLSINIHMMLVSFYRPIAKRNKILVEWSPFPSDLYALKSHIRYRGLNPKEILIELKPRPDEHLLRLEDIQSMIHSYKDELALVYLGSVNYLNGQVYSSPEIVQAAHDVGALIGFDLAHGAGNILLSLHAWNVDFAIWCHYKYLNGGPNCLAGCFVHQNHLSDHEIQRLEGWWGHDKSKRFLMEPDFVPMQGVEAWQISGPPILSQVGMKAALEDFDSAGMPALRKKSEALTSYLYTLILSIGDPRLTIITPTDPALRGCQLSIRINPPNKKIYYALLDQGVVVDWREPGIIRMAPVPMYNSFQDIFTCVSRLASILKAI